MPRTTSRDAVRDSRSSVRSAPVPRVCVQPLPCPARGQRPSARRVRAGAVEHRVHELVSVRCAEEVTELDGLVDDDAI